MAVVDRNGVEYGLENFVLDECGKICFVAAIEEDDEGNVTAYGEDSTNQTWIAKGNACWGQMGYYSISESTLAKCEILQGLTKRQAAEALAEQLGV